MGSYHGWGWRATDFCSHQWTDPEEPPTSRTPYVPIIGDRPRQMKRGRTYQCRHCNATLTVPFEGNPVAKADDRPRVRGNKRRASAPET